MAGPQIPKRFALDSNILFDLAAGEDFAHTFREEFQEKGYGFFCPPTVVQELMLKARNGDEKEKPIAIKALSCMREWKIAPYDLKSVGHGITERFSHLLMKRGLLPDDEFNDGVILAETSLYGIPVIVTGDGHMLNIDSVQLLTAFGDSDLDPVAPVRARNLLHAINIHVH